MAGSMSDARMAMMAMTTNNSMSVNAGMHFLKEGLRLDLSVDIPDITRRNYENRYLLSNISMTARRMLFVLLRFA